MDGITHQIIVLPAIGHIMVVYSFMLELFYSINHFLLWSDIDFNISLDGYNIKNIR